MKACVDLSAMDNNRWISVGLNLQIIRGWCADIISPYDADDWTEPSCTLSTSNYNVSDADAAVMKYSSNILITQLLTAFDDRDRVYLCKALDSDLLNSLSLNSTAVVGSICGSVGGPSPPPPHAAVQVIARKQDHHKRVGLCEQFLYDEMLEAGSTEESCSHGTDYLYSRSYWSNVLAHDERWQKLCAIPKSRNVGHAVRWVRHWRSKFFTLTMRNISNVTGWLNWFCDHVRLDALNDLGLDKGVVQRELCGDRSGAKHDQL